MALVGPDFVFFHIPRTGGVWTKKALRLAYSYGELEKVGTSHCYPFPTKGKLRFTIVRSWDSWVKSYAWLKKQHPKGLSQNVPPSMMEEPITAANCIDPFVEGVDRVLHTETLVADVRELLTDLGRDPSVVDEIPERFRNTTAMLTGKILRAGGKVL